MAAPWLAVAPARAEPGEKEEAAAISQVAGAKAKAGEFGLCAALFHQAYAKDPGYLAYLFSAARCAQKAGDLDAAERDFRTYLARCPSGDKLADKAQQYLAEILEERRKAPPAAAAGQSAAGQSGAAQAAPAAGGAAQAAQAAGGTAQAAAGGAGAAQGTPAGAGAGAGENAPGANQAERRAAPDKAQDAAAPLPALRQTEPAPGRGGLWLALGGAALMAGGATLWLRGLGQADELQTTLGRRGDGLVLDLSHAEAVARQEDANLWIGLGAGTTAVGALLTGAGLWRWLGAPQRPAQAEALRWGPGPGAVGVSVTWALQ